MTINIQKLVDQLTTRAAAADSNTSTNAMLKLNHAVLRLNNTTGVVEATSKSSLPVPVDSAMLGNIAFIPRGPDTDSAGISSYADSHGGYYMARTIGSTVDSCWSRLVLPIDSDTSNTEIVLPWSFQGTVSGYVFGGNAPGYSNVIQKYSFTADGNSTDVGDLTAGREDMTASKSKTHGYSAGGRYPTVNIIDKTAFATDGNAVDVGDMYQGVQRAAAASTEDYGYAAGGEMPGRVDTIQKYSHVSDGNGTDVADLISTSGLYGGNGNTSSTHGYHSGGTSPSTNMIQKYTFATDANATDVANLTRTDYEYAENGASSTTHGYVVGGGNAHYEKFPFATDTNSISIGNLTSPSVSIGKPSCSSSTTFGYVHGGTPASNGTVITKFPFAVDETGTDVGDLITQAMKPAGSQT